MYIKINEPIMNLDGKPMKYEVAEEDANGQPVVARKPLTLKVVMVKALTEEPEAKTGEEKLKRFMLAMKVEDANDLVELTVDEVAKIKELIGKWFTVIVVGRAYSMLEKSANVKPDHTASVEKAA